MIDPYALTSDEKVEHYEVFNEYIGKTVLFTETRFSRIKGDRYATLVSIRIDVSETESYTRDTPRFSTNPAHLTEPGVGLCAAVKWCDRDYTAYRINPYVMRDPATRELLVDIFGDDQQQDSGNGGCEHELVALTGICNDCGERVR